MNKFGLIPEGADTTERDFAQQLAAFPPAAPRQRLDLAAVDAAAAPHGFVSREALPQVAPPLSRRRRLGLSEPTRHLAVRLTVTQYDHFVAYADRHQLTYQDALVKLLNDDRA